MREYRLTPCAERDVEEIWRYTARQWSADQAEEYVGDLFDMMEDLAHERAQGRSGETIRPGYWRRNVGAHVIFYKKADYGIAVVRVLHQRMDIESHFAQD